MYRTITAALQHGRVKNLLVAHQGGWDEVLLVAVPLGLMAWLLWLANRRAGRPDGGQGGPDGTARP
ncbi:MAG: hypothetical protein MKZ66_04785 [Acidimicrobiales bacterium]|nr:hypothetical protein [Acidimicrobiales bacterium]